MFRPIVCGSRIHYNDIGPKHVIQTCLGNNFCLIMGLIQISVFVLCI